MLSIGERYRSGFDVPDWDGFGPAGEPVDHSEEILAAFGLREGSNEVDVDVVEPFGRWLELLYRCFDVGLNLCPLTA